MDKEAIEEQQKALHKLIERIEQARQLMTQKLHQLKDSPHWDPVRAEQFEQKLRALVAERDHLCYQLAELDKGIVFYNPSIRNGVIQPADGKKAPEFDPASDINETSSQLNLCGNFSLAALKQAAKFNNIISLNLSHCNLTEIPAEVFSMVQLQKLDLSHNQLKQVPSQLSALKSLQFLSLCYNQIEKVSGTFESLTSLNLAHNHLAVGGSSFEGFQAPKLATVSLGFNQLTALPPGLFEGAKNLRKLYANDNQLEDLPVSMEGLKLLELLALDHNKLKDLGPASKLDSLTSLGVSFNLFSKEPVVKGQLRVMVIEGNPYTAEKTAQEPAQ